MKALKTFIKPFEAPQRSVKIKVYVNFISIQLSEMHGTEKVNDMHVSINIGIKTTIAKYAFD